MGTPVAGNWRAVALVVVVVTSGACDGSGDTPSTSSTASAPSTTMLVTTTDPADALPLVDGAEVCARFDIDQLESILGPLLEPPRVDPMAPTCAFLANEGVVYVRELTGPEDSEATATALYDEDLARITERAVAVEEVGDLGDQADAFTMAESVVVMVRLGPQVFNVESDGIDLERLVAVAGDLVG